LLGIEEETALRRRRRNPILARLQDKIRSAARTEAFVHAFCMVADDGTENYFEAIGEVSPAGAGPAFGFVRRVRSPADRFFASPDEDVLTELPSRRGLG